MRTLCNPVSANRPGQLTTMVTATVLFYLTTCLITFTLGQSVSSSTNRSPSTTVTHRMTQSTSTVTPTTAGYNCTHGNPCLRPPPCVLIENVTCRRDENDPCRPRYFSTLDASEVLCNPNELTFCEFGVSNLSCPSGWTIKMWFAMFGPAPAHVCPPVQSFNETVSDKCPTHSILWEMAHLCDRAQVCSVNITAAGLGLAECSGPKAKFLRLEYTCIGSSSGNSGQSSFFLFAFIAIVLLFLLTLVVLFVTVHFKKKKKDNYPMNSLHAPLTDYENPEV